MAPPTAYSRRKPIPARRSASCVVRGEWLASVRIVIGSGNAEFESAQAVESVALRPGRRAVMLVARPPRCQMVRFGRESAVQLDAREAMGLAFRELLLNAV